MRKRKTVVHLKISYIDMIPPPDMRAIRTLAGRSNRVDSHTYPRFARFAA